MTRRTTDPADRAGSAGAGRSFLVLLGVPAFGTTFAITAVSTYVPQETLGHRGRSGDPLYRVRRTLRTRTELLTDKQKTRLETVFAAAEHAAVEVTWWVYQQIITAYADPDPSAGRPCSPR